MRILHFTDLHSNVNGIGNIEVEISKADLVVLSGDITHFGRKDDAMQVINTFFEINSKIIAVTGNCDYPEVLEYLEEKGINIEEKIKSYMGIDFTGLGGSLYTPFNTPNEYPDDYYEEKLEMIRPKTEKTPLILVSHQPPKNTKLDKIMLNKYIGSMSVRKFIESSQPLACLCGHIHESKGIDKIGDTQLVNPGPWRAKNYAIIDIEGKSIDIKLRTA